MDDIKEDAKPKKVKADDSKPAEPSQLVLSKNHGFMRGQKPLFFPAGTKFCKTSDAALIGELHRSGAQFE